MRKTLGLLMSVALGCFLECALQAEGIILPALTRPTLGINTGELLLGEVGCAHCHQAVDLPRLHNRPAPRLGRDGLRLTPQYLRTLLMDPSAQKPGSTMPDVLHQLPNKAEAVDALVHFLISFQEQEPREATAANEFLMEQGRLLFHQVGCVACHAPEEPAAKVVKGHTSEEATSGNETLNLRESSVPLGRLGRKMTVAELARYLNDPIAIRPSGRCPSFNLSQTETTAVAMYLLRDQAGLKDQSQSPTKVAGLQFQYYEGQFNKAQAMDNAKAVGTGVVPRFVISPVKRSQFVGLRFTGYLQLPAAGDYTFYCASDDGTMLYIDGRLVVDNDGEHANDERSAKVKLDGGEHTVMLLWFNYGGPAELKVSYAGPGVRKQEIPAAALSHLGQPMRPLDAEAFTVDAAKVKQGKEYFSTVGCAACHTLSGQKVTSDLVAPPLNSLASKTDRGCLQADRKAPRFGLSSPQRKALGETLAHLDQLKSPLSAEETVQRTMATLNCYACHARKGVGGVDPARAPYFTTTFDVDMGDEGRLPPHLNEVGAKLNPPWLKEVLLNKGRARPYMATRMPQFGVDNVGHLPGVFGKSDYVGSPASQELQRADAKHGRRLVGTTGLSCIACHTFSGQASLGIPAMDLTLMPSRLQKGWFQRYLRDPAALRPGTRMPTFWPDGKAANKEVLEGNTDRQIEAIWTYLTLAKDTGLPPGLIQGKMELVVTNEAVIYRHWIGASGPRTIAVGYPERANLAFDVDTLRLALIWQGPFIDAARHRTGRGDGFGAPLGYNVIQFPQGPAFARLENPQLPWPTQSGADAGFRLLGYKLDDRRRPEFSYQFADMRVTDYVVDVPGDLDGTFRRTITISGEHPDLWFRAWAGSELAEKGNNTFLAEGKVTLRIQPEAVVRRTQGRAELLVPLQFKNKTATIVEEIIW